MGLVYILVGGFSPYPLKNDGVQLRQIDFHHPNWGKECSKVMFQSPPTRFHISTIDPS